jgi:hypothetical protein
MKALENPRIACNWVEDCFLYNILHPVLIMWYLLVSQIFVI